MTCINLHNDQTLMPLAPYQVTHEARSCDQDVVNPIVIGYHITTTTDTDVSSISLLRANYIQHWIISQFKRTHLRLSSAKLHFVQTWMCHGWHGQYLTISHYDDAIMGAIGSQITSLTIVYSTVYSGADQSKHQSSASLAFVWGIHRGPVNSPHKWPVTRKMFPFDDVIMITEDL